MTSELNYDKLEYRRYMGKAEYDKRYYCERLQWVASRCKCCSRQFSCRTYYYISENIFCQ